MSEELELVSSTDAQFWAQEFLRIRKQNIVQRSVDIADDEGTMIGWFANAMAAGARKWELKEMLREAGVETFEDYLELLTHG